MPQIFWSLIILTILAVVLRQDWIYFLVYVVGGLWIVSHWWVRRTLAKLNVQRDLITRAFVGETINAKLKFENHTWLPIPWLHVQEQAPLELKDRVNYRVVLSIGGRSRSDFDYTFYCKKRGYYPVGPLKLRTGDLFGFTAGAWEEKTTTSVIVYPRVLPLHELGLPSRSPFGTLTSNQRLFEDPTRMSGVRDYMTGDSLRRIHWKASAHEDSLLVKTFQPAIALNISIVLDLNRTAYPERGEIGYSEWAIVVAASLARYATEQRQPLGFICNGRDPFSKTIAAPIPSHHGAGQLMTILALLARIQMHEVGTSLGDWLSGQTTSLAWGTTLLVVTPKLDEEGLWALHNAYRRGTNVMVFVCAPQANFDQMQAQGQRLGVTVQRTVWEDELKMLGAEK